MQQSMDSNAARQHRCHWMAMKPMVDVTMMVLLVWPNRHPLPWKHFVWNALKNYRFVPQSIWVYLPFSTLGQLSASVYGFASHVKTNGKCTNNVYSFLLLFLHLIFSFFTSTHDFPLHQYVTPPSNIYFLTYYVFCLMNSLGVRYTDYISVRRIYFHFFSAIEKCE